MKKATAIRALVEEVQSYLSQLKSPSIDEVRAGITRWNEGPIQTVASREIAVCGMLNPALQLVRAGGFPSLANAIQSARPHLHWMVYDPYPRALIGPNILYRDHHHAAPELYAPLTGPHGWRFDPRDPFMNKEAHEPVWNEPWQPHATMTGFAPFLCIYCWTGDVNTPAKVIISQEMADGETPK